MDSPAPILAVDLDGTLIRTDSLHEALLAQVRSRPVRVLSLIPVLFQGRARFKRAVVDGIRPAEWHMPVNPAVRQLIESERARGTGVWLVTAADQAIADAVAEETGLFDGVLASDGRQNLKAEGKAAALVARFGAGGFDYIGNSRADLPVWAQARNAWVVGSERLATAARRSAPGSVRVLPDAQPSRLSALRRALRPHQWAKNLLVLLPLIAAQRVFDAELVTALLAFVVFSLTASAVYLINDLLDLPSDRVHPRKRNRPFAAGVLPLHWGVLIAAGFLACAFAASLALLSAVFVLVLLGYLILTSAYSLALKRKPVVDVLVLAGLYTARVIAGAAATGLPASFWLLAFSMFIFLSLALAKRYAELDGVRALGQQVAAGRNWRVDDLPLIQSLGVASGLAGVVVLALYINSPEAQRLYTEQSVLWLVCPILLYWITRVWFKTHRGEMDDDPVVFAIRDPVSLGTGVAVVLVVTAAILGPL